MSVKKLLLLGFLLSALLPMLMVTLLTFFEARTVLREEIVRDMQTRANAASHQVDDMMFERLQNIVSWSRLEVMDEVVIGDFDKRLSKFLNELKVSYRGVYQSIYVVNNQNVVIASSEPADIGKPANSGRQWLQISFANRTVRLYQLAEQKLPIASDILDVNQQKVGSLWVIFDWHAITKILDSTENQGSAAALVNVDDEAPQTRMLAETKHWKKIVAAHDISVDSVIQPSAEPPIFNWVVSIAQYRSVVMAPVHRMGYMFILLLIITGVLAAAFAAPLSGRITKPLARLTDYANRFMRSSQSAPPVVDGPIEVRALSSAFGKMMDDLTLSKENLTRAAKLAVAGEMAAAMSHEIRTPLGILRSSAQVLAREKGLSVEGQEVVAFINMETERLNKLVSTLVDSARPRQPEFALHDIVPLVEHAVAMLRMQANKKDVNLAMVVKSHGEAAVAEQILVECDAEQITQVLLNLLLNAIQVLPTGGKVAVSIIDAQDHVVVSVADDGAGVTEAQKEQIFDPFFTQRPGGIGLGLAVSKQIVTAHFGSLTVEKSTLANTGADFRVQLPKRQLLNDA
ncbi:MAG: two-component sensor histidine kinase [Methylotenera sp.]|uniref:histidine kinase n=1 Tax=Methylotenera mobilis TaxID=359408 RepID=A0A351RC93_9PROT|nr:sensor histidine kinase [Methylotenera sp.]MDP3211189.1 sensor histidine kinase [Methylotenera sp.]PPC97016.1 MAG: two-component sensor histidine kinase [Methylotenera sp.]HBA09664.1 sensor histidine kinase [Methylotenera mobilis]